MTKFGIWIGVSLISTYQRCSRWLPRTCRFTPSCSQYALEAVQSFGLIRGCLMGARRIVRCHPFNPGGFDPVPKR